MPFQRTRHDHSRRDMARARGKIACFASSRETGRTVARAHVPRGSRMRKRMSQLADRTTVSHRRRRASRRCNVLLTGLDRPQPARHGVHARQACVLCLLLRDRQRSDTHVHATQKAALRWRPQMVHRTTVLHRRRVISHRCSSLLTYVDRPKPARDGARAWKDRLLRVLPRDW